MASSFLPYTLSLQFPSLKPQSLSPPKSLSILCAKKSNRTGKLRYPSEKKRIKLKQEPQLDVSTKFKGIWRLFQLSIPVGKDPGKDFVGVSEGLLEEIAKVLEFPVASMLPSEAFTVVRKSFDARKSLKEPKFVYVIDIDVKKLINLEPRTWDFISELQPKVGLIEHIPNENTTGDITSIVHDYRDSRTNTTTKKPKVAVVGSGPSGLFASLVLAELGADVSLIERGEAVEQRGRDIGALVVRKILQLESNFCFGEVLGVMGN